ncbi:MAG: 3-isopropylmalate dehydratase small subunit [Acidobacteriota bacterium]|jgi:3-isopropylmalate/(R)-2-methylmalate dehydratase small subunit|nr:3-isopropylmalate dehydratase small subunit [Bryobacteraceae bacterium CoA2 C42]MCA2965769.1 3-isopropylmalate dehydratase small subunit [Acidobacteriaceae bacterium]
MQIHSTVAVLPNDNIDTDQIIPARFLKTISKEGLGDQLFFDWRYNADGSPKADFVLNTPAAKASRVLLAGDNFGCGSSREHAPWALTQYGLQAVLSTSFADIFKQNSLKNRLLPIVMPKEAHTALFAALAENPALAVTIDLPAQTMTWPGGPVVEFPIDAFAKDCLLQGVDEIGYVLKQDTAIAAFEAKRSFSLNTLI